MKIKTKCGLLTCLLICLFCFALAGCSGANATDDADNSANTVATIQVEEEDLDASWDAATATIITLAGETATVDGAGAAAAGTTVTINEAGTYVLSGTAAEGQIVVEAPDTALVRLVLNGVSLHNSTTAPIYCEEADKLLIILADGTENTLSDGEAYDFADETTDEPNATIFSKQDLTINGNGSLTVTANYNNGIGTKDDLIIVSGSFQVTSANHGLRGRDSVTILDGDLTIDAGNDGIQANNDEDTEKGWVALYGGGYAITAAHDGIQAETYLIIDDGHYTITSGGGSEEMFGGGKAPGQMNPGGQRPTDPSQLPTENSGALTADTVASSEETTAGEEDATTAETTSDSTSDSYKGLKAGTDLTVAGGQLAIDSADDAIHANGNITIHGGDFTLQSGDDGVHADGDLIVAPAAMTITECFEGLEGATVTVQSGEISITANDDGINAAGGSDGDTGGFGTDSFTTRSNYVVSIEGGTVTIDASGDGIDSNQNIYISGGVLSIDGPSASANSALDYEGDCEISGGALLAAGASGMAQMPGSNSSQPSLMVNYSSGQSAGTTVELKDGKGNTIISHTSKRTFQNVIFSDPSLEDGTSYTLYTNGTETVTVTLNGVATAVTDTGSAYNGSMGGAMGGGRGNMGAQPDRQNQTP